MLKNFAATLLIALPVATAATPDGVVMPAAGVTPSPATTQRAKRADDVRAAMQEVQEARSFYSAGRYTDAVEAYKRALAMVPQAESTQKTIDFIKLSLADALIAKAMDYREVGRSEEAVSFLQEALVLAPDSKIAKRELSITQDPVRTNPALTPQHKANVEEVNRLLTLAYGYYDLGKFDEADATFNSVLEIDAYNSAARRGIEQVALRRQNYNDSAYDAYRSKALADVGEAMVDALDSSVVDLTPAAPAEGEASVRLSPTEVAVSDYLAEIAIKDISFDDATLDEVVESLQGLLRRAAAQNSDAGKMATNIVTNFGTPDSDSYKAIAAKTLRLSVSNVSFRDLLDMVCQQLGISYYYVPAGIELTYSGKDFGPLISRSFTVPPYFFASPADVDDDGGFEEVSTVKLRRINPVAQLKEMGVSFPKDATARYMPSTRTLHVRNTAYNMEQIEELLHLTPEGDKLVVLNIFLVSVSKDVLEELGFEILLDFGLGENAFGGGGAPQTAATASGMPSITTLAGSQAAYVTNGLRSGEEVFISNNIDKLLSGASVGDYTGAGTTKSPGIFGFRGVWNAADLTVLMRGLSQNKGVDVLQNPQLIFRPGMDEQVSIAAVREMYYPETYDPPQISTTTMSIGSYLGLSSNYVTATIAAAASPTEFTYYGITEDQFAGVGTLLQVHSAEVAEGGQHVTIALSATVNEFEGFINWGSPIYTTMTADGEFVNIELTDNKILKPMFKRSYENTSVTLAPGSVIVLGGLQESIKVKYEDKIPVLGDLPLVGRLFRTEGEQNETKVLLLFAKVNIVDPTGIDVHTGKHPEQNPM